MNTDWDGFSWIRLIRENPSQSVFIRVLFLEAHHVSAPLVSRTRSRRRSTSQTDGRRIVLRDLQRTEGALARPGRHLRPRRRFRRSIRPIPISIMSRPPPAASGRPPTPAPPGRPSSTTRVPTPSAASPSIRRTLMWSGSAPARTTASAASATATASTNPTDGGKTWKNVGLQDLRAHRQDPARSARLEHRLCRRPGTALGPGRRSRPVQDHRRRQDLEQGACHQREHRRHRCRPRSAQPRCAARRRLPAPPPCLDADRRRPGKRPVSNRLDGGKTLDEAHRPACRRRTWAASAWPWRRPIPTSSTPRSRPPTRRAASSAPPIAATPGRSATTSISRPSITPTSSSIRKNADRIYVMNVLHPRLRRRRQDAPAAGREVEARR